MSSLPLSAWTRNWSVAGLLAFLLTFGLWNSSAAQGFEPGEGTVRIVGWPDAEARETLRYDILPFIDTMTVAYRYDVRDGRPFLALRLDWIPGDYAVYRGVQTPMNEIPGEVRMAGLDFRAAVVTPGGREATLSVVVDSMVVGPGPDFVEIELPDLTWENVFVDTEAEAAKAIFLNGFRLQDLQIAGAAFAVFDEDVEIIEKDEPARRRGRSTRVSIYRAPDFMDVFVDVNWLIRGFTRLPSIRGGEPRESMGRGSSDRDRSSRGEGTRSARGDGDRSVADDRSARDGDGRSDSRNRGESGGERKSGDRSGSREDGGFRLPDSSGDDDDDDDDELVPYALAAMGAAGILAAVGGTIGYYGNSRHAPVGLTSGFVRRDGGLLLQAAVNEALLFDQPEPKRLMVKLLSFGNFLNSGLQPALGAGVLATSEGEGIEYEPTLSVGAVGMYRMFLFYGGYDVLQQGPEFSVALNIHELGFWKKRGEGGE